MMDKCLCLNYPRLIQECVGWLMDQFNLKKLKFEPPLTKGRQTHTMYSPLIRSITIHKEAEGKKESDSVERHLKHESCILKVDNCQLPYG